MEDVFLDVCGLPLVLRSDRGAAFTGSVLEAINKRLGIIHRLGSSYHSQAQGYIEARHKPINAVLKAFCGAFPETQPRVLKYFSGLCVVSQDPFEWAAALTKL